MVSVFKNVFLCSSEFIVSHVNVCVDLQDLLDFDTYFKPHADKSIEAGIRMVNSMTFQMYDAVVHRALHPNSALPVHQQQEYRFKYKLSM